MPTVLAVDSVRGDSVIGDRDEPDEALSETEAGAAFVLPPIAFSQARRTAICFAGFELSARVNLHARIASGIDALLS